MRKEKENLRFFIYIEIMKIIIIHTEIHSDKLYTHHYE
jgi:hypothetical protein